MRQEGYDAGKGNVGLKEKLKCPKCGKKITTQEKGMWD